MRSGTTGWPRCATASRYGATAVAVLPELPRVRHKPVAEPRLGTRDVAAGECLFGLGDAALELGPVGYRLALPRRVRTDLRVAGPAGEICVGLRRRDVLDASLDANLPAERIPVEEERSARVLLELASLAARRMRVEHETRVVEALDEHHAHRRCTVCARRRERRRLRHAHGANCILEPPAELDDRIVIQVGAP